MRAMVSFRVKAALAHLIISVAIVALVAIAIYALWFPGYYSALAGGAKLFWLIVLVDLFMGPSLTFVVFSPAKSEAERRRDLLFVCLLQFSALAYGLHTMYLARPVALVFEVDRFRVITAKDVFVEELNQSSAGVRNLSISGPILLGVRTAEQNEKLKAIQLALQGYDTGQRPSFWVSYERLRQSAIGKSRPIYILTNKYPDSTGEMTTLLEDSGLPARTARYLPVTAPTGNWIALMTPGGDVVAFARYDGFF